MNGGANSDQLSLKLEATGQNSGPQIETLFSVCESLATAAFRSFESKRRPMRRGAVDEDSRAAS